MSQITFSIDQDTMLQANKLFASFGITTENAVNLFLHQAVLEQSLPFSVHIPSHTIGAVVSQTPVEEAPSRRQNETPFGSAASEINLHSLPSGTILAHPEGSYSGGGSFSCPGSDYGTFGDDDEEIGCQG